MTQPVEQRRYPIGMQTFSDIRRRGFVYVDKTSYIHRLAHASGKYFFLGRPRRFGKSLLLSTMQAYFEGRRELFSGLAVEGLEHDWEAHPVLRIDLSAVKTCDVGELKSLLDGVLRRSEEEYGRNPEDVTPGSRLAGLVMRAYARAGRQVVVLVDEYDAPLLNVTHDADNLTAFRLVMREFFALLKSCDEYLRFVFITGITKFSQLSIFSELNNLRNISLRPEYAGICGIEEGELTAQLAGDVERFAVRLGVPCDVALARLKRFYDGYHFSKVSPDVYNPFSLFSALDEGEFGSYWFASGTPTFLIELLDAHGWDIADLERCVAIEDEFDVPTERLQTPLPMLYQAGYLTIKSYDPLSCAYTLGIPNEEVSRGLSTALVEHAAPEALGEHAAFLRSFAGKLRRGDMEGALEALKVYLAGIPYHLGEKSERGFQTTFFLIFDL